MSSIARLLHPWATFGLKYIGTLSNGARVYTNRKVARINSDRIEFEGGGAAGLGIVNGGRMPGRIVVLNEGTFQSINTR